MDSLLIALCGLGCCGLAYQNRHWTPAFLAWSFVAGLAFYISLSTKYALQNFFTLLFLALSLHRNYLVMGRYFTYSWFSFFSCLLFNHDLLVSLGPSSGQDAALSRRKHGFKSRRDYSGGLAERIRHHAHNVAQVGSIPTALICVTLVLLVKLLIVLVTLL